VDKNDLKLYLKNDMYNISSIFIRSVFFVFLMSDLNFFFFFFFLHYYKRVSAPIKKLSIKYIYFIINYPNSDPDSMV